MRDCLVMSGQQGGATTRDWHTQRRGTMILASALPDVQPCCWDEHKQLSARSNREQRPEQPQCAYYDRYGHLEDC